ncbi:Uncharacterized protein YpmB [Paenibacillaceae bacterium GAS479]|nr:Uncharacterized protein YpmB [Paenibacillaceae bacterium GAS479]
MARGRSPRWYFNRRGWTIWGIVAFLALLFLMHAELRNIQKPVWAGEEQAAAQAKEKAGLVEVESAEKYVWDEPLWVVSGRNDKGNSLVVWLLKDKQPHTEDVAQSAKEATIAQTLLTSRTGADIIRIRPGWYQGKPIWEAHYSLQKEQKRYYYDFYEFVSGKFIATYSLTAKRSS